MKMSKRLLLLPIILLMGCTPRNAVGGSIERILLGNADFAEHIIEDEISTPLPEEPSRSAARYLYLGTTPAHHVVVEYPTTRRAEQRFDDYQQGMFQNSDSCLEESSIPFTDTTADEMRCGCTRNEERKVCSFIARYQQLVTFINVDIGDYGFSIHDFYNSISRIEDKVISYYLEAN